ncbi:GlcNAc-PI de-N-acetylase [Nocardioides flavus (ex Wang et al. 2016)]|uniref:GlcNAc-PI de-N-acetylase n=1 Tax=Nocardioides flavus (ex Wang et al. 2016) TaxID=2058780 RepID=A0ABQ3HRT4_9ACTN|nr:PIG-L family deacetylase [Nocardioides flavus (ex Wang et al. 2016)]GHE18904.1 GlcNAc-PI de-N-acetylase [Nocardioides flavus (ex Wang et al. 2016)]
MATIVSLHAHPDDEALLTGGWLAQRSAAGDRIVLVFATDGAAGLADHRHSSTSLAQVRRAEATVSATALGAARVTWLGYADSGMANRPSQGGRRFVDISVDEAARELAAIVDHEGADILTGYDANGGYGHPDHVQVHRVARRAQTLAAFRPLLLEATLDRTWLARLLILLRPLSRLLPGLTLPGDGIFTSRDTLTLTVDVRPQLTAKRASLAAHASQHSGGIRTVAILLALPRPVARRVLGTEWFVEVP